MENFSDEAQPKHTKKRSKKTKQKNNLLFSLEEKNIIEQLSGEVEYTTHSVTSSTTNSIPENTHKKHRRKKNLSSSEKNILPKNDIYIEEKIEENETYEHNPKYPTSSFIIYKKEKENDNEILSSKHKFKKIKSPLNYSNNDIEQNTNDIYFSDYTNNNNFQKIPKNPIKKTKNLEIKKKLKKILQKKLSGKYLKIFYYNKWFTITYETPGGNNYEIEDDTENTKYKIPKTNYNPGMTINKYLVENEEIEQEEEENEFNEYKTGDLEEIEERPVDEEESVVTSTHVRGGSITARNNIKYFALRKILKYKNKFFPYFMKWKKGRRQSINVSSSEFKKLRKGKKIIVPHKNNSNSNMGSNINTPIPEDENEEYSPQRIKNIRNNVKNFILFGGSKSKILKKYYDEWYKKTFYESKNLKKKEYVFPYLKKIIDNKDGNSENKIKKNNQSSSKNKINKEKTKTMIKSKTTSKLNNIKNNNDDADSSIASKDSLKKRKIKKRNNQDGENNINYEDPKYKTNNSENQSLNDDSNDDVAKINKNKNKKKIKDIQDDENYDQGLQKKRNSNDENNEIIEKITNIQMNHLNNKSQRYLLIKRQKIKKIKHNDFQKKLYKLFLKTVCRKNPVMLCFDKWFDQTYKNTKKYLPFSKNNIQNKGKIPKASKSKKKLSNEEEEIKIHYKLGSKEPLSKSYRKKSKNKRKRQSSSPLLFGETNNEKIKNDKKKLSKDAEKIRSLVESDRNIEENDDLLFKQKPKIEDEEDFYYHKDISESWNEPNIKIFNSKKSKKTKEKIIKKTEQQEEAPRQRKPGTMQFSKEIKNENYNNIKNINKSFNNTDKNLKIDLPPLNNVSSDFYINSYDDIENNNTNKNIKKSPKSDDIPINKKNIKNDFNKNNNNENYLKKREINYSKEEEINPDVQDIEIMQDEDEKNNENKEITNNKNDIIKNYKNALHLLRKAIKCYTKRMKKTFNPDFAIKIYFYKWVKICFEEGLTEYRKKKELEFSYNNDKEILEQKKLNSLKNIFSMIRTHQKKLRRDLTEDQENEKFKKWAFDKWYENMTISNFKQMDSKDSKDNIEINMQNVVKKEEEIILPKISNENDNKKEPRRKSNKSQQQEIMFNRSDSVPLQKTNKLNKKKFCEFEGEGLLEMNDVEFDYNYEYKKSKKNKNKKNQVKNEENNIFENNNNNELKEPINKNNPIAKENIKDKSPDKEKIKEPLIIQENLKNYPIKENVKNYQIKENYPKENIKNYPKENVNKYPIQESMKNYQINENEKNYPIKENENKYATKDNVKNYAIKENVKNYVNKENEINSPIKENKNNYSIKENNRNSPIKENVKNSPIKENKNNYSIKENNRNSPIKENIPNYSIKENDKNYLINENGKNYQIKDNIKSSTMKDNIKNSPMKESTKKYPIIENGKNYSIKENNKNYDNKENVKNPPTKENTNNKENEKNEKNKNIEKKKKQHDFFQRLKNEFSTEINDNSSTNYILNDKYDPIKEEELSKKGSNNKVLPPPQVMALQKKNNQKMLLPHKKTYSARRLKSFGHGKIENVEPGELVSSSRLFVIKEMLKGKLNKNSGLKYSKSTKSFNVEKYQKNLEKFSTFMQKYLKNFDKILKRKSFKKWDKMTFGTKITTIQSDSIAPMIKQKKQSVQPTIFLTKSLLNNNEENSKEINDEIVDDENKNNKNKNEIDKNNPNTIVKKAKVINLNKNIYASNKRNYEFNNDSEKNEAEEFKNESDHQEQLKEDYKNDNNFDEEKFSSSNKNKRVAFTVNYSEKNKYKPQKNDYNKISKLKDSNDKINNNMLSIVKNCNFAGKLNNSLSNFDGYIKYLEEHNKKMKIYQLYYLYVLFNENNNFYILRKSFNKWKANNKIFKKNISKNHIKSIAVRNMLRNKDKIKCICQDSNSCLNCDCTNLLIKLKKILIRYQFMKEINPVRFYFYLWFKETFDRVIKIDVYSNELE